MKLYDVVVVCYTCGCRKLVPMFAGESEEDLQCEDCGSKDIEVW